MTDRRTSGAFAIYLVGQGASLLGNGIVPLTFAFAALEVAPDGRGMPMVLLALWLSRFAFMGRGGVLPDRIGRLPVMIRADAVRLIAQLFPAVLFVAGRAELWHLIASATLYGIATAYFVPASIGLLPELVEPDRLQWANSRLDVAENVGMLAGPALASVLVVTGGVQLALAVDAVTFVVSIASLLLLRARIGIRVGVRVGATSDPGDDAPIRFRDALRLMPQLPFVLAAIVIWCPVQIGMASLNVLGPIVADREFGGVQAWAPIATALGAGGLLGALVADRIGGTRRGLVTAVLLVTTMAAQLVALALGTNPLVIAGVFLVAAMGSAVAGVIFDTLVQLTVPEAMLSRVGSFEQTMTTAMVPLGLVIAVPIATWVGLSTYLVGLAAVVVVTGSAAVAWAGARTGWVDHHATRPRGLTIGGDGL
ncbi:MAG: MFS transporter [Dermatophilaceae bacterium]